MTNQSLAGGVLPPGSKLKGGDPLPPNNNADDATTARRQILVRELPVLQHCGQGEGAHSPQSAFEPNLSVLPGCTGKQKRVVGAGPGQSR